MNAPLLADVEHLLSRWEASWGTPDAREAAALTDARSALAQDPPALWRQPWRTHVTCSAFVLSPDLLRVLLVHHAKGNFWVQPGGHPEQGDASVEAAALRETLEETGLRARPGGVVDLDHHDLPGAFGHCASHLDFGLLAFADPGAPLTLSEESHDVAWFGVEELPPLLPSDFEARLRRVLLRASLAAAGPSA